MNISPTTTFELKELLAKFQLQFERKAVMEKGIYLPIKGRR